MRTTLQKEQSNAKSITTSSGVFLFLLSTIAFVIGKTPLINELESYNGIPKSYIVKSTRHGRHIEFQINDDQFYYSGENHNDVISIITSKSYIEVKSAKNHGFNRSMNVIYVLSQNGDHEVVTYDASIKKDKRTKVLLFSSLFVCLLRFLYGLKLMRKCHKKT